MSSSATTIEPVYVIDTNALIWHLTNERKLGKQAGEIFASAERGETRLIVSAITIAEMYFSNKKNGWFTDFPQIYRQIKNSPHFRLIPFIAEHVLDIDQDSAVFEMHDRIIAGLARRLGAPLLTSDPQIAAAGVVAIVW